MRGISIEKPANHALVLGFVFSRLILKKLDTSLGPMGAFSVPPGRTEGVFHLRNARVIAPL
jgi:hypothetical protein